MKTTNLNQVVSLSLIILFLAGCAGQTNSTSNNTAANGASEDTGPLKAIAQELPYWKSEQLNTVYLEPLISGGSGWYTCAIPDPTTLPEGVTLNGDVCTLSGTIVLAPGTTRKTFPPFTIIVSDDSEPPQKVNLTLTLTAVSEGPTLEAMTNAECIEGEDCSVLLAKASGGDLPYTFTANSFAGDAPPQGTTIGVDGVLKGDPPEGFYIIGICVADVSRTSNCGTAYLTVQPKGTKIQHVNVTVTKIGKGTVTSVDGAINCGTTCTAEFKQSPYGGTTLKTTYDNTTTYLLKWEGCSWGYTGDCHVDLSEPRNIKAIFNRIPVVTIDEARCERLSFDTGYAEESPYYATYKITATGTVAADYPDDGLTIRVGGGSGYGSRTSSGEMLFCPGWEFGADMPGWGCHGTDAPNVGIVHWRYEEELRPNGEIGKYYLHASIERSFDENASYLPPIEDKTYLPCQGIQDSNEIS
ncbi:MAG: hypothetical protein V1743_02645 [Nanoarchaeota archaeon]